MGCQLEVNGIRYNIRFARFSYRGFGNSAFQHCGSLVKLRNQIREIGNVGIPLQKSRDATGQLLRQLIQMPYRFWDGLIVRIDQVLSAIGRPRKVDLYDAGMREISDVMLRIEAMIEGRHVNVVYIKEKPAT